MSNSDDEKVVQQHPKRVSFLTCLSASQLLVSSFMAMLIGLVLRGAGFTSGMEKEVLQ